MLGVADHEGLIARLFGGMRPDEAMFDAVAAARRAGVRTGLVSNSWGEEGYDRARFAELFDVLVISGELGIRKPAPEIYALAAERLGRAAGALRVRRRPARQPQAGARRSGWRRCCTATPARRSPSSRSTSASACADRHHAGERQHDAHLLRRARPARRARSARAPR